MNAFSRFGDAIDLHIVAMLVFLVLLAIAVGASASAADSLRWLVFSIIAIVPQFRVLTRCLDLRRFGRSPVSYLFANELLIVLVTAATITLHVVLRSIYSR